MLKNKYDFVLNATKRECFYERSRFLRYDSS